MQRQAQLADKRRQHDQKQAAQYHMAAVRAAEKAQREAERALVQAHKASVADQKAAKSEAQRLHVEAREAEVAALNAQLVDEYEQIDGILAATLGVDDYVDLQTLRHTANHPPFEPGQLAFASPPLPPIPAPREPEFVPPPGEPRGLSGVLGAKKKYAEVLAQARAEFERIHQEWHVEVASIPARQQAQADHHQRLEAERQTKLQQLRAEYDAACSQRELDVHRANEALDQLINNLAYDVDEAVQEYVSIVLGNSVYPDCFPVEHDFEFNSTHRELTLTVSVSPPSAVPLVSAYKYAKAKDEITSTSLPQKDQKERYANALAQVALRTLHEIFEADRAGRIQTISLTVATSSIDAATGRLTDTPLLAVATDRPTFEHLDLANVVPSATLAHLKANVSKNPFGLVPIDISKGVRG